MTNFNLFSTLLNKPKHNERISEAKALVAYNLQSYRDEYSETHGPKKNRAERRRIAKMKKNRPKL